MIRFFQCSFSPNSHLNRIWRFIDHWSVRNSRSRRLRRSVNRSPARKLILFIISVLFCFRLWIIVLKFYWIGKSRLVDRWLQDGKTFEIYRNKHWNIWIRLGHSVWRCILHWRSSDVQLHQETVSSSWVTNNFHLHQLILLFCSHRQHHHHLARSTLLPIRQVPSQRRSSWPLKTSVCIVTQ